MRCIYVFALVSLVLFPCVALAGDAEDGEREQYQCTQLLCMSLHLPAAHAEFKAACYMLTHTPHRAACDHRLVLHCLLKMHARLGMHVQSVTGAHASHVCLFI